MQAGRYRGGGNRRSIKKGFPNWGEDRGGGRGEGQIIRCRVEELGIPSLRMGCDGRQSREKAERMGEERASLRDLSERQRVSQRVQRRVSLQEEKLRRERRALSLVDPNGLLRHSFQGVRCANKAHTNKGRRSAKNCGVPLDLESVRRGV